MRDFEYVRTMTLKETINLLIEYDGKVQILAGGTDVLVKLKQRKIAPALLIDIKGLQGLTGIEYNSEKGMKIGALTLIRDIETSPVVLKRLPALAYAAQSLGSVQIRNRATFGGNLCNALPSADMAPYLITMGAQVQVVGPEGERKLSIEELFVASEKNSLRCGEVVTAVEIPKWDRHMGGAYLKHALKNAVDVAVVSVASAVALDPTRKIFKDVRLALGAVGPTPIRPIKAEDYLRGKPVEQEAIMNAAVLASKDAKPRTKPEYKKEMVRVLTIRTLTQALEEVQGGQR
jgi:carbon-monoxide dehydrogenase medium subunit